MLETSKVFEKEAFMRLIQKVRYETFFQKGLIVELDVAERGESSKDFAFKSFDKLRIEDFSGEHIRIEIASAVLQELVKSKVLKKEGTDYRLRVADLNDYNLPLNFRLYYDAVDALLARSFAYRLAFNRMTRQKDGSINIPMLHKPHQQLLWDLVDAAAIAPVTVGSWDSVSRILEAQYPEYFSRETLIEIMRQEVPGLTVNKAWNLLREKGHLTEAVFSSTYTITDKQVTIYGGDYETTNNRLQNCLRGQMLLRKETTKQEIAGIIDHLKGLIITLDCPEPYLQELYDALGSRAPAAMEEINIFMLNGLNDIIRFKEQPYTWKMIFYTTLTVVMGLVQIAIGIAIQLFTVGLMSHVGVGFISEGVGDLIFAVSAMRSGYFSWSAYWQHKKESIMFTVVTCGIGAFFARGAQVSRYGAKFAQQGLKSAGKEVASKAGKELIKEVGWSTVRNTVLKDFALHAIKGVALGVTSQAVAALVDNHLRELCVGFAASFYQQIRESAKKHKISQTIDKLYAHLGARKSKELFESHLRSALSERAFNETTSEAFLRYGVHVSRQIGDGLGSMNRQSSTPYSFSYIATLVLKLADYVSIAKNLYELGTLVDQLLDRVNNSLLGCSEMLNSQPVNNDREERENFKKSSLDFMNDQMNEQIGTIIGKKFVEPLLQTGANYLVNYLGRHIKKQYRSYKNYEHAQEFEKTKKEYEAKRKEAIESEANEETRKSIDQKYHSTLNDLKKRVRDPKLYAAILREGGHMDMQSLKAYAGVLDAHLKANGSKKGYLIEVKGNDGTSFTLQCGDPENVTKVELQVDQEHFTPLQHGTQMNESSGGDYDCLLNALKSEISELDMDNRMLREQIARRVETDLEIGETIRSGQHALGIRRGLYGGIRNRQNSEGANQIERTERWEFKEKVDVDLRNNGTTTRTNQEQVQDAHVEAVKLLERLVNCYTDDKELRGTSGNREIDVDNVRDSVIKAMNDAGLETPIQLDETKFKATKYVEKKQEGKESVWVPVQFEYYEAEGQPGITIRPKLNRSGTETCEMRLRLEYNVDNPIVPDNGPPHPHIGYTCRVTNGPAQFRNITGHIIFDDNPNLPGRQRSGMRSYENLPTQARVVDVDWTKTGNARPTRKDGPPRRNSFIGILVTSLASFHNFRKISASTSVSL
ncbi:unnamed protein product, partial [Mesorhabditis belari]|uniref:Uncharacterized protein n=1 Tax=Mesorhabditis belari TaxID=2138241 RepID=A0AAF3EP15_9BILA